MSRTTFNLTLSREWIYRLIIKHEVTSRQHYTRSLQSPVVPPLESGVTIGIGYDLGHTSAAQIRRDWQPHVTAAQLNLLVACAGLRGDRARNHLASTPTLRAIVISWDRAVEVFYNAILPIHAANAVRVYRDLVRIHPIEQTAIVGSVFNRGADVSDTDRRREMRALITAIQNDDDTSMASHIRSTKRLWQNTNARGLLTRREEEALAILMPDTPLPASDLLRIQVII